MKKRFFAVALATTMVMSSAVTALAESVTVTNAAWWDAWTPSYEIADGATVKFTVDLKNGGYHTVDNKQAVYCSLNAVFTNVTTDGTKAPSADNYEGYKEYVALRSDAFGWGDEYANTTYTGTDRLYVDDNTDYQTLLTGAHYDITISRTGNTLKYDYVITESDGTKLNCGYEVAAADLSAGCYVLFTGDAGVEFTLSTEDAGSTDTNTQSTTDSKTDTSTTDNKTDTSATTTTTTTTTTNNNTTKTPKTGDVAPVAALASLAVVACAGVVVSRKKVTE